MTPQTAKKFIFNKTNLPTFFHYPVPNSPKYNSDCGGDLLGGGGDKEAANIYEKVMLCY